MEEIQKSQCIYKLRIEKGLQEKIQFMCNKSPDTEWSGTLFYKVKGSFEKKDLVITPVDFLVLDIGTSGYTEFDNSPETAFYIAEHGYEELYAGLIHSHNRMAAFFSGVDEKTLNDEGLGRTHFLSLIVNNAGSYCAKITRKISCNITEECSYYTFNEEISSFKTIREESRLQSFDLNIVYPKAVDKFPGILDVYHRILKEKEDRTNTKVGKQWINKSDWDFERKYNEVKGFMGGYPICHAPSPGQADRTDDNIEWSLKKLLTLNFFLPEKNSVDINKVIAGLENLAKRKFTNPDCYTWVASSMIESMDSDTEDISFWPEMVRYYEELLEQNSINLENTVFLAELYILLHEVAERTSQDNDPINQRNNYE